MLLEGPSNLYSMSFNLYFLGNQMYGCSFRLFLIVEEQSLSGIPPEIG